MKRDKEELSKIGRPRGFIPTEALHKAMFVFWEHGYETTSMSLLTKKMEMNAPSIYAAFGDKKALFLKALDLYVGHLDELQAFIESAQTSHEAASQLLKLSAIRFTGKTTPRGCLLASAVASVSPDSADVQAVAGKIRLKIEGFLKDRIERDLENKVLPKNTSSDGLAGLTLGTIQGMSVLARDGASRKKLLLIGETAMLAWPKKL